MNTIYRIVLAEQPGVRHRPSQRSQSRTACGRSLNDTEWTRVSSAHPPQERCQKCVRVMSRRKGHRHRRLYTCVRCGRKGSRLFKMTPQGTVCGGVVYPGQPNRCRQRERRRRLAQQDRLLQAMGTVYERHPRLTVAELAANLDMHPQTVSERLRELGVEIRPTGGRRVPPFELKRTVDLYASGLSLDETGRRLGLSRNTVRNRLDVAGYPIRSRSKASAQAWAERRAAA